MLHDAITENVLGAAMKVHSHVAQVLTYLKLSGHRVALLINSNVPHLRDGIRRVMHGVERSEDPGS